MPSPAPMVTPPISTSHVVVRLMLSSGGSKRSASSMACGSSERSARTASSWSGWVNRR